MMTSSASHLQLAYATCDAGIFLQYGHYFFFEFVGLIRYSP